MMVKVHRGSKGVYFAEGILSLLECDMEKAMAPHSSTLAWEIPQAEEPGRLQSMGLLRVGQDWASSLSLFTFMHWRRKWQPTPVFLPGKSQWWGSLVGFRLWGCTELDTTKAISHDNHLIKRVFPKKECFEKCEWGRKKFGAGLMFTVIFLFPI